MTMTVEQPHAVASGPAPLTPMSADEARACVDRIKRSMEDIRADLWHLKERQGWRALGYVTWQDCIRDEFAMSRQRGYQLVNAYTVDRILAGVDDVNNVDISSGDPVAEIAQPDSIPEAHARELTPIIDDPDAVRAVVAKVRDEKGDQATAEDVRAEVDEHLARPPRAKAARSVPVRRSVGSKAEAGDYADDAPDYTSQTQETYGAAPNAEKWCGECGGKYRGERCPCASAQPAPSDQPVDAEAVAGDEPTATAEGPLVVDEPAAAEAASSTSRDDAADEAGEVQLPVSTPAPPARPDQPGAAESQSIAASPDALAGAEDWDSAPPAPPADSRSVDPAPRTGGVSIGKRPAPAPAVGYRPVEVDGQMPQPVYPTADGFLNGVESHLAGEELDAFAQRFSAYYRSVQRSRTSRGEATTASASSDLQEALANRTILEIRDAITTSLTADALPSLLAVLADEVPAERLGPLAHRLAVRTKNTGDLIDPEPIADVSLTTVKASIRQLSSAEIRSLELELPLIRKEVGAAERAGQRVAV